MAEESKPLAERLGIKVLPTKFATPFEDAANLPKHESHMYNNAPLDKDTGDQRADPNANIDQKVYWFPEAYNALRIEMHEHWPSLFAAVGWFMAHDGIRFIECMDAALDTKTTFDSAKVNGICAKYLDLLRNKRGLSSLHLPSEKA